MQPATSEAYRLLHEGAIALARMEHNGIRIDEEYLHRAIKEVGDKIYHNENELKKDPIYKNWRKRFGDKTKLGSKEQLALIVFEDMGYTCRERTKPSTKFPNGRPKADESSFAHIEDVPFIKNYFENEKLKKLQSTYLGGIRKEVTSEGRVHTVFNTHLVVTFRSSCSDPNLQNVPIRNPEIGEIIRRAFIPDDNSHLVELDYGRIEVHAGSWYHKDKTMLKYLRDPTTDMHRDMAFQIYKFTEKDVDKKVFKQARYGAKNKFVFPQFYGDYYKNCARNMWEWIDSGNLKTLDGKSIKEKFPKGLGKLDDDSIPAVETFAHHMKEIEHHFWNVRFPTYTRWKKSLYEKYLNTGGVNTLTGFLIQGIYKKNEILNSPIQGLAFHCLLWSIIRIDKELRRRKMKSKLVLNIHDSLIASVPRKELQDYIYLARSIMIDELTKAWPFICTPLEVEPEVTPFESSWHEKEKYVEINDKWQPEPKAT